MSRQIYQNSGLIIALVLAGISLTFGIIGVTRESTHVDYDENYYNEYYNQTYYINQTYYGENITDYSKPLETSNYYNLDRYDCFMKTFNISTNFLYWYHWNASGYLLMKLFVARSIFYDDAIVLNGTIGLINYLEKVDTLTRSITYDEHSDYYTPPYVNEWLFVFMVDEVGPFNITLTDEILPI